MFTSETEKKLNYWLSRDTWHTMHPGDMIYWYDFVDQYQKDHGYALDEAALREYIERKISLGYNMSDEVTNDFRDKIIRYVSIAYYILQFLEHTGR